MATQRTPLRNRTRRGRGGAQLLDLSPEGPIEQGVRAPINDAGDGQPMGQNTPVEEAAGGAAAFEFPPRNEADEVFRIASPEPRATPQGEAYDFERVRRELNEIAADMRQNQLVTDRRFAIYEANTQDLHRRVDYCTGLQDEMRQNNQRETARVDNLHTRFDHLANGHQGLNNRVNNLDQGIAATRDRAEGCWQSVTRMLGVQADLLNQVERQPGLIRDEVQRQMEGVRSPGGNLGGASGGNSNIRLELPTFEGAARERPMRYLDALASYCDTMNVPARHFPRIVGQSLRGLALEWWYYVKARVISFGDFEREFKAKYWNDGLQVEITRKLEFGFYEARDNLSRAEYAIKLYNDVCSLDEPPTDPVIIKRMSRHFDENIRVAAISRNLGTFDAFINLLESFDDTRALNSTFENMRRESFSNTSFERRTPPQRIMTRDTNNSTFSNHSNFRASTPASNGNNTHRGQTGGEIQQTRNGTYNTNPGRFTQRTAQVNEIDIREVDGENDIEGRGEMVQGNDHPGNE